MTTRAPENLTSYALARLDQIRQHAKDQNMSNYDDLLNRLNNTKPVNQRDPFIRQGSHELIVASIEIYKDQKWGDSIRVTFETERSNTTKPGDMVCKLFNLFKPAKFDSQSTDADEFVNFVCLLQGVKPGEHAAIMRALIKRHAEGGMLESQPARGARIRAFGAEVGKANERGERYVKVSWQTVEQDQATVARTRAELDARRPLTGTPVAAPQPAPVAPPQYAQAPVAPVAPQYQQIPTGHAMAAPQTYQPVPGGYGYPQVAPTTASNPPGPFSGFFGKPPGQ
jgi:hypothetical protein